MTLGLPSLPPLPREDFLAECEPSGYDTDVLDSDSDEDELLDSENTPANLIRPPSTMFAQLPASDNRSRVPHTWRSSVKNRDRPAVSRIRYTHRSSDRIPRTSIRESSASVSSLRRSDPASLQRRSYSVQTSFSSLSLNSPVREEAPSTPELNRHIVFPAQELSFSPSPLHGRGREKNNKDTPSSTFKLRSRSLMNLNDSSPLPDMPLPSFPLHESTPLPSLDDSPFQPQVRRTETQPERRRGLTQSASMVCRPVMRAVSDKSPGRAHPQPYPSLPSSYRHAGGMIAEYDMYNLPYPPVLPLLKKKKQSDLISRATVVDLIEGRYADTFDQYFIIDCRYEYEFNGGHIRGASSMVPVEAEQKLQELFLNNPIKGSRVAIVFHCEFSSKRGPRACELLRKMDRLANRPDYPNLHYPYVYVMEGGYQKFYEEYKPYCDGEYLAMKDKKYTAELYWNKKQERKAKSRSASVVLTRPRISLTRNQHSQSFSHFRPT